MSCQDDLSQLMPTLYSQVRLAVNSDSTANLRAYAEEHQLMGSLSPVLPGSAVPLHCQQPQEQLQLQQQQQQSYPVLQRHTQRQQDITQRQGMGRRVARRAFHLELRFSAAMAQARQPEHVASAGKHSYSPAAQTHGAQLDKLKDISNERHSRLQLHPGSGRTVTKRSFSLAMPPVQTPEPQTGTETAAREAFCTPQAAGSPPTASWLSAHTSRSSRASFGSAMEGVPERPWRSIAKTPAASRLTAASSIFQYTPMEGVPERMEGPAPQQSIRRQSMTGRLRAPAIGRHSPAKQANTPVSMSRPDTVLRLHLSPGDEAQLQEVSPVVGLLEPQQQPEQQQQTAAEQCGSMGFFGSLCSAPPVNTPGSSMHDEDEGMYADGYEDFSDESEEPQLPSSPGQHTYNDDTAAEQHVGATPASRQQPDSLGRAGLPTVRSAARHSMPWSASSGLPPYSSPRFHEMEVQTGASLQNSPTPAGGQAAELADSPTAEQPCDNAQQEATAEAEAAPAAAPKAVRKSEAHQRLKACNRQRRSLAGGEGLHGEVGVRRSSRDKHAPLEYWRNERKVYGREFRSLPTVHHYATRTPSPSWKFVQDLPHKRSRLAQSKAAENQPPVV
ncbi:hypothetical protein ABBQ38_003107 [Trebouxia sp. C0009 RCD-2024]